MIEMVFRHQNIFIIVIMIVMVFRMGDSFRSAAWDSQLDNMLDDLQQVIVVVVKMRMLVMLVMRMRMLMMVVLMMMMLKMKQGIKKDETEICADGPLFTFSHYRVCRPGTPTHRGSRMGCTQMATRPMNTRFISPADLILIKNPNLKNQEREEPGRREVMERASRSGGGPTQGFSYQESSSR